MAGAKALLQQAAFLGMEEEIMSGGDLQMLLMSQAAIPDRLDILNDLEQEIAAMNWWPPRPKLDLEARATQRLDLLQSRLLESVNARATAGNRVQFRLVHDTLERLYVARRARQSEIPLPRLKILMNDNKPYLSIHGAPFVNYKIDSSGNLKSWGTAGLEFRDRDETTIPNASSMFFRGSISP
jgi:hypothetical protein